MSFLTPLYIAGALLVTLPILFHLIRRSPRERVEFSSLMFLRESPPRVTRRSRLENLLLLLLRAAALTILAMAFARPFWRESFQAVADPAAGRVTAIVLDQSASMRRGDLWPQALAVLRKELDAARPIDHVAIVTFDFLAQTAVSFDTWTTTPPAARAKLAAEQIQRLKPGWGATHLGTALATAADLVDSHAAQVASGSRIPERRVILISDFQRGSELKGLQHYDWPDGTRLDIRTVAPPTQTNVGIQLVDDRTEMAGSDSSGQQRVRISNAKDSHGSRFAVQWADPTEPVVEFYLAPGKSRVFSLPELTGPGDDSRIIVRGDDFDFDNVAHVVRRPRVTDSVWFVGRGSTSDPNSMLYYFSRAFPESAPRSIEVRVREADQPLTVLDLTGAKLVALTAAVPEPTSAALHEYVQNGGTLLCVVTEAEMMPSVGRAVGVTGWSVEEASVNGYAMLGAIDFAHPLFAPFRDARFNDFTKIHIWRHRRIDGIGEPGGRVIARFDDRDPALVELPCGRGRAFVLATSWKPDDSQLAVSSKFAPLVNAMVDYATSSEAIATRYRVGDVVVLPELATGQHRVRTAGGAEIRLPAGAREFRETLEPGHYTLLDTPTPFTFAVSLNPDESDTSPLLSEQLEQLGVRLTDTKRSATIEREAAEQRQMKGFELEARQKLWRWLAVAAIAVLIIETWLAGYLAGRTTPAT